MSILNFISLGGGLALFLFGMNILAGGMEKISGGKVEKALEKLTSNIFTSVLLGAGVTALIQSSSVTTVIIVGMVNAGILKLQSAVGVIMGANIGTTITGQILRLGDLEGSGSAILQWLKPSTIAPVASLIGIVLLLAAKRPVKKVVGEILLGFGVLFQGMFSMEAAMQPLQESPAFARLFETFQNPVLGVLVGAVVTAIIQSSSASIGILQALSSTGAITYSAAFPIIMGQNIGTCVTSLISSIGANKNAKRTAMVHLYFNIIGTIIFLIGVYGLNAIVGGFPFWDSPINKGGIADFHTLFNIGATILMLPFYKGLARLAEWTVRDKAPTSKELIQPELKEGADPLDQRFLSTPAVAIGQSRAVLEEMARDALFNFQRSYTLFQEYDLKMVETIQAAEAKIDQMEDRLNSYLSQISECELTDQESKDVTLMLRLTVEFERIGDYAINLVERAESLYDKHVKFSSKAIQELNIVCAAVEHIVAMAYEAFKNGDLSLARQIEPLEETIDAIQDTLKYRHIKRLKSGMCTIDAGLVFLEILTNIERISDHCSNIAVYLIGRHQNGEILNRHEYIKKVHQGNAEEYSRLMKNYMAQYMAALPSED